MPTIRVLLGEARLKLAETESPSLDARLLLQHATGLNHAELVADPDAIVDAQAFALFNSLVARRAALEPIARILGTREFYGRPFKVTPAVLDPRADTETVIDLSLQHLAEKTDLDILDLGTGSGILAITLLAERPLAKGVAVDVSSHALTVAKENAVLNGVVDRLQFVESNWFTHVAGRFDLIVSNPPYIPSQDVLTLDVEVRDHDPHIALDGGGDGLDCYRALANGAGNHLTEKAVVVVEIGAGQAPDVIQIFAAQDFDFLGQKSDLGGHVRALAFQKKL
jgi:release factor glutamine methyltransferase